MNLKLFIGISLVIISLITGKITTILFILYLNTPLIRYSSIALYIVSWLLLLFGVYICGIEGTEYIQRIYKYFSYKHYHEHVKRYSTDFSQYTIGAGRRYHESIKKRMEKKGKQQGEIFKNKKKSPKKQAL